MMKDKEILSEEVELSEVILNKTDCAFERIRQERMVGMNIQEKKRRKFCRPRLVAVIGLFLIAISGASAGAVIHHYWGRGMEGSLQADETQQQELVDNGIAEVYPEKEDYASMKVTQNGVSVVPNTVITDEHFAYLSFTIAGSNIDKGKEPDFENINVKSQEVELNSCGEMYNGIFSDEDGAPVYEDGTPVNVADEESVISHYFDEDGNLEYVIVAYVSNEKDTILGKTIDINFQNLGTLDKQEYENEVDGTWNFKITLPNVSSAKDIELNTEIVGTDFKITNVELSPISMKANYVRLNEPATSEEEHDIPMIKGVVLKDGTRLPYLTDAGSVGYYTDGSKEAYNLFGYDRVIDVEQVQAFLIQPDSEGEIVTVDIK